VKVERDTIQYITRLSKLKITDYEASELAKDFQQVLECLGNIKEEDLRGLDLEPEVEIPSILRKDEVINFENHRELFQNAKRIRDSFIAIPKVLD
jgi:aspartyl-tRNA(Asn)/glutamyl-tRNA(Gln) amidotransferase subunit C